MGHVLGLFDEQNRPDRDEYVEIIWEKINILRRHVYDKHAQSEVNTWNIPYDYKSIMHLDKYVSKI